MGSLRIALTFCCFNITSLPPEAYVQSRREKLLAAALVGVLYVFRRDAHLLVCLNASKTVIQHFLQSAFWLLEGIY